MKLYISKIRTNDAYYSGRNKLLGKEILSNNFQTWETGREIGWLYGDCKLSGLKQDYIFFAVKTSTKKPAKVKK